MSDMAAAEAAELPVIAIFGPTASGKSAVAEAIARRVPAELVSADSAQVYRGLPILTNQPAIPTLLVAIWELEHEASVGEYQGLACAAIDDALGRRRIPVVAGGTGLYFRAALSDLELPPAPDLGVRERWQTLYERRGPKGAHALLRQRDPGAAARVHANDRRRVVRALELAEAGHSLSPQHDRLWTSETRHPTLVVGLAVPPQELTRRIDVRAREMFDAGVESEVCEALRRRLSSTAAKVMGLREVSELPREQALAALAQRTRRYAAYQRKWMRRIPGLVSVAGDRPPGEIADEILELARARQRLPARGAGRPG